MNPLVEVSLLTRNAVNLINNLNIFSDHPDLIRKVMQNLGEIATCLKLEEIDGPLARENYIKFTRWGDADNDSPGCWSYVGQQGKGEQVS